jgi:diguanylate cyclase (GGDEF)-like protein/PAS domain S-box-containing protein
MSESEVAFSHIFGIQSLLMLPIFMRGDFWGSVAFQNHKSEQLFDENCIDLLRSASHLCANAVMRTEMQEEIADKNETNRVIFNTVPVGLTIFDSKFKCLDCNKAVLQMYGISKRQYLNSFFYLSPEYQPDGSRSIDKQFEMMKRTINGEKIKAEWMHRSPEGELIPCEITMTRMRIKGKYFGLGYAYDLRHIKKLEQNIQWLESEVDKIYYDPLTGIFNRRYFDMNLQRLVKSFARSGGSFSFMMVDIDRFKRYNDTYGHREGDNCLITVAETLVNCVMRADDFVARYGGEEFAVVLPNTDENGARQIAEKLLESVRNCKIPHENNDALDYVTISIGVTTGCIDQSTNGDDFIKRADEMLYESKQSGRNKYSFAPL